MPDVSTAASAPERLPCPNCGSTEWTLRVGISKPRPDGTTYDVCNVCSPVRRIEHRRRAWLGASWTGFHAGFRLGDGALHFGIKLFHDRSRHYANRRHGEYGIAFWFRRSHKGDRGYPHTLTFKVVAA